MTTNNMDIESFTPKQLLLAQFDALILTMQQVIEQNGRLNMRSWVGEEPPEPEHFCNSAACICGYQALSGRLELFPIAVRRSGGHLELLANTISDEMDDASTGFFGSTHLARSIYSSGYSVRHDVAKGTGLFTEEELRILVYLNWQKPEPQDVIDYLNVCKQKVESYEPQT